MEQFFSRVDVKLNEIYEVASRFTEREASEQLLERHIMNLITMYSIPTDESKLPPIADSNMDLGDYKLWTRLETKDKLEKYVLPTGMQLLQVLDTKNFQRKVIYDEGGYDAIGTGIYGKSIVDLNMTPRPIDISANFLYADWWPIYLSFGSAGEVIMPTSINNQMIPFLSFITANRYETNYLISAPTVLILKDKDAFNGEGFTFLVPLEANIRYNQPMLAGNQVNQLADQGTQICDPVFRTGGPIKITVQDAYSGAPIQRARIQMTYGEETCFIGFTDYDEDNKTSYFDYYPLGSGTISVIHQDYLGVSKRFGAFENISENFTLGLIPVRNMPVSVTPIPFVYVKPALEIAQGGPGAELTRGDEVVFIMERVPDDIYDEEYTTASIFTDNFTEKVTMPLVPGDYHVTAWYVTDTEKSFTGPHRLAGGTMTIRPFLSIGEQKVTINGTDMPLVPRGGVQLNENTGYFTVTRADLYGSSDLDFKVMKFPMPESVSEAVNGIGPDLTVISQVENLSKVYREALEPTWSR